MHLTYTHLTQCTYTLHLCTHTLHIYTCMHTFHMACTHGHICTYPTCVHIHTCTHLTAIHTTHTHTHRFPNHFSQLYEVTFNIYCTLPGFVILLVLSCLLLPLLSLCCLLTQPVSCTTTLLLSSMHCAMTTVGYVPHLSKVWLKLLLVTYVKIQEPEHSHPSNSFQ